MKVQSFFYANTLVCVGADQGKRSVQSFGMKNRTV
jgi:hypothetical protein